MLRSLTRPDLRIGAKVYEVWSIQERFCMDQVPQMFRRIPSHFQVQDVQPVSVGRAAMPRALTAVSLIDEVLSNVGHARENGPHSGIRVPLTRAHPATFCRSDCAKQRLHLFS